MKKSITVNPKPRGRPATGKDPLLAARFPNEAIAQIDEWASAENVSRSEALRRLVQLGLKVRAT